MMLQGINVVRTFEETFGFFIHAGKMGQWTPADLAQLVFSEAIRRHQRDRSHG